MNIALASLSAFLPTIIKTFGFQNAAAQLLTVPPYAVAALVMITLSYISDRIQSRGLLMACMTFIGGVGYLILLTVRHNTHAQYFATFCVTSGTYATIGLNLAWYAHNLGSETKKATGLPIYMAIGQCGSVLGRWARQVNKRSLKDYPQPYLPLDRESSLRERICNLLRDAISRLHYVPRPYDELPARESATRCSIWTTDPGRAG